MFTFSEFLLESKSSKSGNKYEQELVTKLKRSGLTKRNFKAAKSGKGADAAIHIKGDDGKTTEHKIEIKNSASADMSQMSLHHNHEKGWHVSDYSRKRYPTATEHVEKAGILEQMNKHPSWQEYVGKHHNNEELTKPEEQYTTVKGVKHIQAFNADKGVHYLQVKGKGFYNLQHDPLNTKSSQLEGNTLYRARVQEHGVNQPTALLSTRLHEPAKHTPPSNHDLDAAVESYGK